LSACIIRTNKLQLQLQNFVFVSFSFGPIFVSRNWLLFVSRNWLLLMRFVQSTLLTAVFLGTALGGSDDADDADDGPPFPVINTTCYEVEKSLSKGQLGVLNHLTSPSVYDVYKRPNTAPVSSRLTDAYDGRTQVTTPDVVFVAAGVAAIASIKFDQPRIHPGSV
jgi:hypothetical protein